MQEEELKMMDIFVTSNIIVLVLVLLIIAFVVVYRQRILKKELEFKNKEAEHQQNLLRSTLATQEATQARIAKDLHDDLGALLSTIKMRVQHFEKQQGNDSETKVYSKEVNQMLGTGLLSIRRIVNDLLPPILKDFGLKEALQDLVEQVNKGSTLQVHFDASWDIEQFDKEVELPIYRVVQELLNNCLKHSDGQNAWLHLLVEKERIILEYRDDGKGFDKTLQKQNLGFKNFESRVQALNGQFEFESKPDEGFKAFFEIPLL